MSREETIVTKEILELNANYVYDDGRYGFGGGLIVRILDDSFLDIKIMAKDGDKSLTNMLWGFNGSLTIGRLESLYYGMCGSELKLKTKEDKIIVSITKLGEVYGTDRYYMFCVEHQLKSKIKNRFNLGYTIKGKKVSFVITIFNHYDYNIITTGYIHKNDKVVDNIIKVVPEEYKR